MSDWPQEIGNLGWQANGNSTSHCDEAAHAVSRAIRESVYFHGRAIEVAVSGSHRNLTNVEGSAVDIAVICTDSQIRDVPAGYVVRGGGSSTTHGSFAKYRAEVGLALRARFPETEVRSGDKCFELSPCVLGGPIRVAPFFTYRRVSESGAPQDGVVLWTKATESQIVNWPDQQYANGLRKDISTGGEFRRAVCALKSLRNRMEAAGVRMENITGYLIECLCYNVPSRAYEGRTDIACLNTVLEVIVEATRRYDLCEDWVEVHGMGHLFRSDKPWRWQRVNEFARAAQGAIFSGL